MWPSSLLPRFSDPISSVYPTILAGLLLVSCVTDSTIVSPRCDLSLGTPSPSSPLPGDTVSLPATPLTSTWDTAVTVGGHRATVIDVVREDCDTCDSCRATYECSVCGDCDACDLECGTDCIETVEFQVPSTLSAGTWDTWVYNVHGAGGPLPLVVGSTKDTGTKDTGTKDTGTKDTGSKSKDTGSKSKDTGSKSKDTGSKSKDTGSKSKDTGSKSKDTGSKSKGTGSKKAR